jgi:uncharacterized membrane-anchored protein
MKIVSFAVFALAVVVQWAVPFSSIFEQEKILREGEVVRIPCRAPDPYDPLRGRYLAVSPFENEVAVENPDVFKPKQRVYAVLELRDDNLQHLQRLTPTIPSSGECYIQVNIAPYQRNKDKVKIEWPFSRYYLAEKSAPAADQWLRENTRNSKFVTAEVRLLKGHAVITDLSVDQKSFRDSIKETAR